MDAGWMIAGSNTGVFTLGVMNKLFVFTLINNITSISSIIKPICVFVIIVSIYFIVKKIIEKFQLKVTFTKTQ
jgi:hypothetical protein